MTRNYDKQTDILTTNRQDVKQRAREKRRLILFWLLRWQYSTTGAIEWLWDVSRSTAANSLRKLEKQGTIRILATPAAPQKKLIMLTKQGVIEALGYEHETRNYNTDSSKIARTLISHNLACQTATLHFHDNMMREEDSWIPIHQLGLETDLHLSRRTPLVPDAILANKYYLEAEITPKSIERYQIKLAHYVEKIQKGGIDEVHWYAHPQAANRIEKILDKGFLMPWYRNNASKRWETFDESYEDKRLLLDDNIMDSIQIHSVPNGNWAPWVGI